MVTVEGEGVLELGALFTNPLCWSHNVFVGKVTKLSETHISIMGSSSTKKPE